LTERSEEHRTPSARGAYRPTRLGEVGYRVLGSLIKADDAGQEAWLRLSRSDAGQSENLAGWLRRWWRTACLEHEKHRLGF
jgi:DNA-directed RNA polymerase specialized sigma24 family protein